MKLKGHFKINWRLTRSKIKIMQDYWWSRQYLFAKKIWNISPLTIKPILTYGWYCRIWIDLRGQFWNYRGSAMPPTGNSGNRTLKITSDLNLGFAIPNTLNCTSLYLKKKAKGIKINDHQNVWKKKLEELRTRDDKATESKNKLFSIDDFGKSHQYPHPPDPGSLLPTLESPWAQ